MGMEEKRIVLRGEAAKRYRENFRAIDWSRPVGVKPEVRDQRSEGREQKGSEK